MSDRDIWTMPTIRCSTRWYQRDSGGRVRAIVYWMCDTWRWRVVKGNGHILAEGAAPTFNEAQLCALKQIRHHVTMAGRMRLTDTRMQQTVLPR